MDKYHPGYFGKVGMRRFHLLRNHEWKPVLNVDKVSCLWHSLAVPYSLPCKLLTLVPEEHRDKYRSADSKPDTAPVIDLLSHGYAKLLGKGRIHVPVVVRARYVSAEAEKKIKDAGGVVQLVA